MVNLDLKQWSTYNKLKGVARKEFGGWDFGQILMHWQAFITGTDLFVHFRGVETRIP